MNSGDRDVDVIYVSGEDSGLSTGGVVAIVLSVFLILAVALCVIFCRCVKKETDDHFKRLKQRALTQKLKEEEAQNKLRKKISLKKNRDDDFVNIESHDRQRSKNSTAKERSVGDDLESQQNMMMHQQ